MNNSSEASLSKEIYPNSSAIIRSYFSNFFSKALNVFSDLDFFSSFTSNGIVVKRTLYPLLQAIIPSPIAICVFPVPGFTASIIFCPVSIKSNDENTFILSLAS